MRMLLKNTDYSCVVLLHLLKLPKKLKFLKRKRRSHKLYLNIEKPTNLYKVVKNMTKVVLKVIFIGYFLYQDISNMLRSLSGGCT